MKKDNVRDRLFATTVLAGLAITGFAQAQTPVATAPAAPAAAEAEEEDVIVVTGSRLVRQDFTAISPVTSVSSEDIALTNTVNLEQLLNELPQVIPGATVSSNNPSQGGRATIDLRGLGANRTLVLVDGRRVPPASPQGFVDLNVIPAAMVDRVEVVTGGASAVYGSDAIAGVVNFILKKDYEGAEFSYSRGRTEGGLSNEHAYNFLFGGNLADGRGNFTIGMQYYNREKTLSTDVPWAATSASWFAEIDASGNVARPSFPVFSLAELQAAQATAAARGGTVISISTGGSAAGPKPTITSPSGSFGAVTPLNTALPGTFTSADTDCNPATAGVAVTTAATLSVTSANAVGPAFNTGLGCGIPLGLSTRYNFNPTNYYILPAERFSVQGFGTYKISDSIQLDTMITYTNTTVQQQLAPTPLQLGGVAGSAGFLVPSDNAFIDTVTGLRAALNSRANPTAPIFINTFRTTGVGPRIADYTTNNFVGRAALTGEIGNGWDWELAAGYGNVKFDTYTQNNVNRTALIQGVNNCRTATGAPPTVGIGAGGVLPGCVNINPFNGDSLTPAMQSFLRLNSQQQETFEQTSLSGFVRGDLFQVPAGPVSVVAGIEYREDEAAVLVDAQFATGNVAGFNAAKDQRGAQQVTELYGEIAVPLLSDQPFAHFLGVEGGIRYSNYSTVGTVESYKIGGEYAPVSWVKFRTVFNSAVRAPGVTELFQAGDQNFPGYTDPCNQSVITGLGAAGPSRQAFCVSQGVPVGLYPGFVQPNTQVQELRFGSPNLKQESAETFTIGAVIEPDFLPVGDLRLAVDYYDIKMTDRISLRGVGTLLSSCYGAQLPGNSDCANIIRNPLTGEIVQINTGRINLAESLNRGIDVTGEFSFDLEELFKGAPGRASLDIVYSYTDNAWTRSPGGAISESTGGFFGLGGGLPKWRVNTTARYEIGDLLFQLRHVKTDDMVQGISAPPLTGLAPGQNYLDGSVRWNVTDQFQITVVGDNLTNEEPPIILQSISGGQGNTEPSFYRPFGRSWSISGRLKF